MDAATVNVVWMVVWFLLIWGFPATGVFLGSLIAIAIDEAWAGIFVFLGWLIGGALAIFSIVQVVLHIISLVQLVAT